MKITYFVHSITEDNEKGLATGWLDGKLSEEGLRRAKILASDLSESSFDAVFTSDLSRAIESSQIFFGGKHPLFVDWRLRECNYGTQDGKPAISFKKGREQEYIATPYPEGESYGAVERRIDSFLNDAKLYFPNGHIAIVAHQAPQLALEVITNNKTWEQAISEDWRKSQAWQPGWAYLFS